jgi:hypothetical protein
VNGTEIYAGNYTTWTSTLSSIRFPLMIVITPNATFQVYYQLNVSDMSNYNVNLLLSPTSPIVYSVLAAGVLYTGAINVVVTDVLNVVIYNGSSNTYSTVILLSRFPINIVVTPALNY